MSVELRPAAARAVTRDDGRRTSHSFSFGAHYDPADVGFGALVAHNDDCLDAHRGYPLHRHAGLQIVTWVLTGRLHHRHVVDGHAVDSELGPDEVQVLGTGPGVEHSEFAGSEPVHLIQAWLPDESGAAVRYRRARPELCAGEMTAVVGPDSAMDWSLPAGLAVAELAAGQRVRLLVSAWTHLFVARGSARFATQHRLATGDAVRLTDAGGDVSTDDGAQLLVWSAR